MDNRVIARIAREHGPKLIEKAIRDIVSGPVGQDEIAADRTARKPSLGKRIASAALIRVATRSVPGAILVGGGLIAKALHDRHKARLAASYPGKLRR